jgi:hypothetical protein
MVVRFNRVCETLVVAVAKKTKREEMKTIVSITTHFVREAGRIKPTCLCILSRTLWVNLGSCMPT